MIWIRYRGPDELSPGLFAAAERHGRSTVVYLLSGLSPAQRRSALRRLKLSARMGHCPRLPAIQLALALLADRIRTSLGRTGAVVRMHPAGSTLPVMLLSGGAIAFLLLSTVSIQVLHPRTTDTTPLAGSPPIVSASADPAQDPANDGSGQGNPDQPGSGGAAAGQDAPGTAPSTSSDATSTGPATTATSGTGTTLDGSGDPNPQPDSTASTAPTAQDTTPTAQDTTPADVATPTPSPSASSTCLDVGPLGICLDL